MRRLAPYSPFPFMTDAPRIVTSTGLIAIGPLTHMLEQTSKEVSMTSSNSRTSEFPIDAYFLDRWSPRAFTDDTMDRDQMLTILDAAHWAPSSGNNQPWRFIYGLRGTPAFETILDLLVPGNQRWAKNAAALMIIVSKTYRVASDGQHKPAYTHSYDTGAAWFSVICQTMKLGFHAHGMEGFDMEKAVTVLELPEGFRVEAAAAIGCMAAKETLPEELQSREVPSGRKPVYEIAFEGKFSGDP